MTDFPSGWITTRLDEVAEVKLGRQRSPKNHTGTRMRPYLRAANVTWDGLDLSDVKEMNFTEEESTSFTLSPGDIVLAEASGSAREVGKPAIWRGEILDCCFQNTLLRVRSHGPASEYLLHVLRADALSGALGDASRGVGIHHLGAQRLSAWVIPVAPVSEQRRIVEAIEEQRSRLEAGHASLSRARRRLERLRASATHQAFARDAWDRRRVADVADIVSGQTPKGIVTALEGPIPFYKVGDMNAAEGGIMRTAREYLDPDDAERFRVKIRPPGTVIFPKRGGAIATNKKRVLAQPAAFDLNTMGLIPGGELEPGFLAAWFKTVDLVPLSDGSNVPQINHGDLAPLEMPVPPRAEQRRIVAEIERELSILDATAAAIDATVKRSAALRRAILDRAFRGTLVPQDPSDEPASVLLEQIVQKRAADQPKRPRKGVSRSRSRR